MWIKRKLIPATILLAVTGAFSINQAQAIGKNEAAILVGVAVGGLTTYALQNAGNHHHHSNHYQRREYHEPPRRHHSYTRVEHYVIHKPPQHRGHGYHRSSYGQDKKHQRGRDKRRGGGYEYEYEYKRRTAF